MDEDLYDEFGNFIGDPSQLGFSEDSEKEVEEYDNIQEVGLREEPMYGDDVEVLIETQDREADRSIIAQNDKPIHGFTNKRIPKASFVRPRLFDGPVPNSRTSIKYWTIRAFALWKNGIRRHVCVRYAPKSSIFVSKG